MGLLKENISFVVVCYKSSLALKSLLLSIPKESEVILVDNSQDKETEEIANLYDCILIQNQENLDKLKLMSCLPAALDALTRLNNFLPLMLKISILTCVSLGKVYST